MTVDKRIKYQDTKPVVQGGVDNYLGKQPQVQAPRKWQSAPDKPATELAYITEAEKDLILKGDLHGSLKKGPNIGPSGIMSLDSFGDIGGAGASGGDTSAGGGAMEGRGFSGRSVAEMKDPRDKAFEKRVANERAALQIAERAQANRLGYNERQDISRFTSKPKSRFGGLGSLLRGAMGIFGGIPGRLLSGLMAAKNWAKNKGQAFGEEIEEFSNYPTLDRYLNRNTDKYKDKPYLGQGKSNYSFDRPTLGKDLGLFTNRQNAPIGPGLRVGQNIRMPNKLPSNVGVNNTNVISDYPQYRTPNLGGIDHFNNTVPNELFTDNNLMADASTGSPYTIGQDNLLMQHNFDPAEVGTWSNNEGLNLINNLTNWDTRVADGGRVGYQGGELVEQQTDLIEGPQGGEEFQETVVEGQAQPSREQLEALSMHIFQLPLEELDDQQLVVVYQAAMQGQPMEEAVQEEDVQFAANGGLAGLL